VTDYGLPSFLCGQDFQESEADQYKRKKARIIALSLLNLLQKGYLKRNICKTFLTIQAPTF